MASELCMNCFSVKGQYEVCPFCGYVEGTPPEQPHYLTPGTILGNHFIVGTVIGFGGFGITYKCFDTTLGVTVAVKEFYPMGLVNRSPGERKVGLLSGDRREQYKERLKRFLMEAQSVAQFGKAKDIVNVYDFFEENGTAYIIMEYIDGVLLKDYLDQQGAMDPEAALSVIMPIIEAVKKIHSKGIIHRDVSPDNIFIEDENTIKIFDFGAAQLNDSKEGMAAEKIIKVGYSPLEQYRDKSRQGFYTDIYSVGAILYEMLTGMKPIESTEREFKDELKSPIELGIKINANTDRAVMEALAVRPELRFQGIQQFEEALLNKRAAEYPSEKLRRKKRKRNWIISLSVTLALAVGIGFGLYSTVLKPENRIFDTSVKEDTITVWVENEDQKKQIDELKTDGFRKGNSVSEDEKVRIMQAENEKVEIEVEVHPDMENDLKTASADENIRMPNMFLTDHVSDIENYDLVSMEDNVYASLNLEEYVFMSEYEKHFSGMKEMPTGIDTLLLYTCQFDYNKNNCLEDSNTPVTEDGTVELMDLVSEDTGNCTADKKLNNGLAVFRGSSRAYGAVLENPDWMGIYEQKENPNQNMLKTLSEIQSFNKTAHAKKYKVNSKQDTGIYGSNTVAGVAFRKTMNGAADSEKKGANPLNRYKTYVITHDDKMMVTFSERYAITKESTENQKTACMRLLWVMLGETGQEKKTAPDETTYPILKTMFNQFGSFNANYDGFVNMVNGYHQCILVCDETGKIEKFSDGLGDVADEGEMQEYCMRYVNGE